MKNSLYMLCLLVLLPFLSSCGEERQMQRLPDETKEWIKVRQNKIAFTNTAGEQEELTVSIKEEVIKRIYGDYEHIIITFSGRQADLGFKLQADKNFVDFINIGEPTFDYGYLTVVTDAIASKEYLTEFGAEGELFNNYTINGIQFDRVLHLTFTIPEGRNDRMKELFYAKSEGVISFITTDNKVWHKQ